VAERRVDALAFAPDALEILLVGFDVTRVGDLQPLLAVLLGGDGDLELGRFTSGLQQLCHEHAWLGIERDADDGHPAAVHLQYRRAVPVELDVAGPCLCLAELEDGDAAGHPALARQACRTRGHGSCDQHRGCEPDADPAAARRRGSDGHSCSFLSAGPGAGSLPTTRADSRPRARRAVTS